MFENNEKVNLSIEASTGNISLENENSPSSLKVNLSALKQNSYDISFPNFQHKYSTKILGHKNEDEGKIKEEIFEDEADDDENDNFTHERRKSFIANSSNHLKQKLNLIENDNLINYKPFISKSSAFLGKINEVREETPHVYATNSPRIKLMTDNVEDVTISNGTSQLSPRYTKAKFEFDKTEAINEDSNENVAENGKAVKHTSFHKIESFIDKYEENLIESKRHSGDNIIEEIKEVNNEEESPTFKKNVSYETPKSDEFDKADKNFSLRKSLHFDDNSIIREESEKKNEEDEMPNN